MTVKVPTIKFTVACSDCNEDVELEFLPNGTLHAVDDRDYYNTDANGFTFFVTNCGHDFYWHFGETNSQEPLYWMMVAKYNWEPNDKVYGHLMPGPDGLIQKVVTV